MTNGECIYHKTVDYMSRMALEKDDFRRFSVIWEFRVTGNWVAARVASRLEMGLKANDLKLVECFASEQKNIAETARRDKHQVPTQTIKDCVIIHISFDDELQAKFQAKFLHLKSGKHITFKFSFNSEKSTPLLKRFLRFCNEALFLQA